jgi:hypothetical protein
MHVYESYSTRLLSALIDQCELSYRTYSVRVPCTDYRFSVCPTRPLHTHESRIPCNPIRFLFFCLSARLFRELVTRVPHGLASVSLFRPPSSPRMYQIPRLWQCAASTGMIIKVRGLRRSWNFYARVGTNQYSSCVAQPMNLLQIQEPRACLRSANLNLLFIWQALRPKGHFKLFI